MPGENDKPIYEVTKNVTDADRTSERIFEQDQAAKAQSIAQEANQKGFLRQHYIDPEAAKELPQREGVHAIGKVGLFNVWNGTAPEFPFAAWAQQHQPSVNTQLMQQHAANIKWNGFKTDEQIQNNLDASFNKYLNDDIYGKLAEKYGGVGRVQDILAKGYANDNQEEKSDFAKINQTLQYYSEGAALGLNIAKEDEAIQKEVTDKGERLPSGYAQARQNYLNSFTGGDLEANVKQMQESRKAMDGFADVHKILEQNSPKDMNWGTTTFITKTKDDKGNLIPGAYSDWKVENPDGTDATDRFKSAIANSNDDAIRDGKDLGFPFTKAEKDYQLGKIDSVPPGEGNKKRIEYLASVARDLSSQKTTETISRKADINNTFNTGANQVGSIIKAKGEIRTFGVGKNAFDQTAVSAYKLNDPVKLEGLGNQHNVITTTSGKGGVADLDGATIGNIENRYVKIVDGQVVMTNETGDDVMLAPMAAGEKPVYKEEDVGKPVKGVQQTKSVKTDETEDFLMPSSYIGSGANPEFLATQRTAYNEAMEYNKEHTSKKTQEQFQKYFGQTEVDVNKSKKGTVSITPNTPNPGYSYNAQ